jgi:hypothetical protein
MKVIRNIWTKIKAFFHYDPVEEYLSKASDLADLERRLDELNRNQFRTDKFL